MHPARRCSALTVALLLVSCRGLPRGGPGLATPAPAGIARAWLTTGDKRQLLARQPDVALERATIGPPQSTVVIDVDDDARYQAMLGFGAALTDASAELLSGLAVPSRDTLMRELFGADPGIGLSVVRIPMGASDFSRHHYSYDDMPPGAFDSSLAHFSIDPDRATRLPLLRQARAINAHLELIASPWSAPAWMKTSGSLIQGTLRADAYAPFAAYFRRFIQDYAAEGVPVFAVTPQNEPAFEPPTYPGMRLDANARATLIGHYLGPALARAHLPTRILDWDHNWDAPAQPLAVLADTAAARYVSGVAWHCYAGEVSVQDSVRRAHPDKDVYFTECSGGAWAPVFADNLRWYVSRLVIGATRTGARSVVLWNLALDERGGPHLGGCGNCRGVITIDSATHVITRNEEYYALAHASRFVRSGARRIASSTGVGGLESVAFRNVDDGTTVLIVLNTTNAGVAFTVRAHDRQFVESLPGGAVVTIEWR